jgi:hypothetical protein
MQMKINEKILSIPPYISTSWTHISALRMKGNLLSITLTDGETISISGLSQDQINLIFSFHAVYLEKEILPITPQANHVMPALGSMKEGIESLGEPTTLSFAFGSVDGFNTMIQHNQSQANSPDLPPEILNKISQIARAIIPFDDAQLPKAEPHCNCFHCQIARSINPIAMYDHQTGQIAEEEVRDEELQFEQWTISSAGEKLYNVVSRLDEQEKYRVYLGTPVGCTCGKEGCEHILAVLKS